MFDLLIKIIQITEKCSAEVLFPRGEKQRSPEVQASCEQLLKIDTKAQEEDLYQQYKTNQSLLSVQHLPGMYKHCVVLLLIHTESQILHNTG